MIAQYENMSDRYTDLILDLEQKSFVTRIVTIWAPARDGEGAYEYFQD